MSCSRSENIHAFVDSELSPSDHQQMVAHQCECNECRSKAALCQAIKSQVKQSCSKEQLDEFTKARILKLVRQERVETVRQQPVKRRWMYGAGLASAAGFVLFSSLALTSTKFGTKAHLAAALIHDHSRCLSSTNPLPMTPTDPAKLAQASFGKAPEELSFPGLSPVSSKICPIDTGKNALHLVYRDRTSKFVSLYGLPETDSEPLDLPDRPSDSAPLAEGQPALAWHHGGWIYSLVSEISPQELNQVAREGTYLARNQPYPTSYPPLPSAGLPTPGGYGGLAQPASFQR